MQSTIMLSRSLGTVQGYASWGVAKQGMQPGELAIISKEAIRNSPSLLPPLPPLCFKHFWMDVFDPDVPLH